MRTSARALPEGHDLPFGLPGGAAQNPMVAMEALLLVQAHSTQGGTDGSPALGEIAPIKSTWAWWQVRFGNIVARTERAAGGSCGTPVDSAGTDEGQLGRVSRRVGSRRTHR